MTSRRRPARFGIGQGIGSFEALEPRLVLSYASNVAIITDISRFYANYVTTIPGLVQAYQAATPNTPDQQTAGTNLTNAITADVNDLAQRLYYHLGPSSLTVVDFGITGDLSGATPPNTSGEASPGSLLGALLALDSADPAFLAQPGGIAAATDYTLLAVRALANPVPPTFPFGSFGNFSAMYFTDVQPLATLLAADQSAAANPPTPADQAAIAADVAAIDRVTVADVNSLATSLQTTTAGAAANDQLIRDVITGSASTTGVTFVAPPGTPAGYGSLLAALQSIETDPAILQDSDAITALIAPFAYF